MKRTFVDAGVLIAAARGQDHIANRAMAILVDSEREFASSDFVRLEVLPKAVYHKKTAEIEFYQAFFEAVSHWAAPLDNIVKAAYQEACQSGLAAIDALHVAAAVAVGADELVTTEKPSKPLHRSAVVEIVSIQPD